MDDGSVIYLCTSDHHASIVPWQIVKERFVRGGKLLILKRYDINNLSSYHFDDATVVMAPYISNVLGTINDIANLRSLLPESALLCLDASQARAHVHCDVQNL